eukprot:SAG31_NODE_7835_length_1586_cov_1.302623_3_plen_39_part_00
MLFNGKPEANVCLPVSRHAFESLPSSVQPLMRVWLADH